MPTDREIIEILDRTGHLKFPFGEKQELPPLNQLVLANPSVVNAVKSYQDFLAYNIEPLIGRYYPERRSAAVRVDGKIGPAMQEFFTLPRCACPDYSDEALQATGTGQYRGCHNIGDFHCAIVKIMNAVPAHLLRAYKGGTVWDEIKRRVRACYDEVGLRIYFSDDADCPTGNHQTELTFVTSGAGWIGLAIIGQGQQCSSRPIWLRLVSTYLRNSSISDDYLTLWANLVAHEIGHNISLGHTRRSIMNPGILLVPTTWIGDPVESRMKSLFGGKRVVLPDVDLPRDLFDLL